MRNNNLVTPELLMDQVWMQEEDTSGVKIVELKSSTGSSKESGKNYSHPWSYINNATYEEHDSYTSHDEARRRIEMEDREQFAAAYANQCFFDHGMQLRDSFDEAYEAEFNSVPLNHQMNCFTIINNHHVQSDSSKNSENYDEVEVVELDKDTNPWEHVYNDDLVTYKQNKQQEKRTIWIYSYKNKRLLSENDYELVNIPSKDASSTSCSISDEEQMVDKSTTSNRIGSPIPGPYIPKLDLSLVQTLSTVTEITEPNKSQSKEFSQEVLNAKPINNWLTERHDRVNKTKSSSVVCWMALSPRERRRRSINTNSETSAFQYVKETEITYAEGNPQIETNRSSKTESATVQVQVDVHPNNETRKELLASPKIESKPDAAKIADIIPMKISFADADHDMDDNNAQLDYSNRPSIQISARNSKAEITEPIEKLDCNNWIIEETIENDRTVYDELDNGDILKAVSSSDNEIPDSASRRLWMRNMQLMKGPQWTEYLPITCTPPSLHLTVSLSSLGEKKSWFERLTRCMKCWK